jgi:hypothetical protein
MPDYNEVRCETDCRVKKLDTTVVLVFSGVPSDSRVVVYSISSLLGISCSGIIIACRDSM